MPKQLRINKKRTKKPKCTLNKSYGCGFSCIPSTSKCRKRFAPKAAFSKKANNLAAATKKSTAIQKVSPAAISLSPLLSSRVSNLAAVTKKSTAIQKVSPAAISLSPVLSDRVSNLAAATKKSIAVERVNPTNDYATDSSGQIRNSPAGRNTLRKFHAPRSAKGEGIMLGLIIGLMLIMKEQLEQKRRR